MGEPGGLRMIASSTRFWPVCSVPFCVWQMTQVRCHWPRRHPRTLYHRASVELHLFVCIGGFGDGLLHRIHFGIFSRLCHDPSSLHVEALGGPSAYLFVCIV